MSVTVLGAKSALYHAGISLSARKKAHKAFIADEIQVHITILVCEFRSEYDKYFEAILRNFNSLNFVIGCGSHCSFWNGH